MQIVYNPIGIGDVMLITLAQEEGNVKSERFQDVVRLTNEENGNVVGYNIFSLSSYFELEGNGTITPTENLMHHIDEVFYRNGVKDSLEVDLSPKFVVGYVKETEAHEDASKLKVCQVDVGDETLQIVCGAPNVAEGQKVVVAKVGAVMPSGMFIKESELRGVPSHGMICSAKELNLDGASEKKGILVLEDDKEVGEQFHI
ncbi:DUF4479 domain-containing protein [Halalkalibacillus sediminis]|uniref:DUF4479 domain-containing protein n=1 Tax=Halalkalibacillus sediminis TaxID=2018042 RepID=A0A2I0QYC3_9BACI|nr:DUF4479 family protein [Halalkalibacillus sediminis]PKR79323.1 DUF4479 domain-containing protein [Halalkalibacillus sediminis]